MFWLKVAVKTIFLIIPIGLALAWLVIYLVVPKFGPESVFFVVAAPWLALLIANWIWPPDYRKSE
jgi:hypothetical protein